MYVALDRYMHVVEKVESIKLEREEYIGANS
jgi:hypothetical protein